MIDYTPINYDIYAFFICEILGSYPHAYISVPIQLIPHDDDPFV